ncbi:MAG: alpha/beta hydrolase [Pseudomonadota bacterium]
MTAMRYEGLVKAPPHADAPLVFAFHGTGGDEHQFFDLAQQINPGSGVVSPRGDVTEFGARRFFKRTGEGIYDMADLARAVEKLAHYVRSFDHRGPVYGFGYSNGANVLAATIMQYPKLFDRVGLLHPLIPWQPDPVDLSDKTVLITAGRQDPITPWSESERLVAWFEEQGANVSRVSHGGGHEIRPAELSALTQLLSEPVAV